MISDELTPGGLLSPLINRARLAGRPQLLLSRANLKISDSTSGGTGGRPADRRYREPSNFCATSLACQRRIVSGLTIVAMASRAFRPSCFPILASVAFLRL